MKYNFDFVLRSDDFVPVYNRLNDVIAAVKEILFLDGSAVIQNYGGSEFEPEGTGNLCRIKSEIESDDPSHWLNAAVQYATLRDLDVIGIKCEQYKEPVIEIVPEIEELEVIIDEPDPAGLYESEE